jgi:outer membrane cobalamin receptor
MFAILRGWRIAVCAIAFATLFIKPGLAQHEHHAAPAAAFIADVTGVVRCADGPQLPGAVVQAFKADRPEKPIASALSDQAGRFRLRLPTGNYMVRVNYLGHHAAATTLSLPTGVRQMAVPEVRLQVSAVELEALVVVANKERLRLQAGAVSYDAKASARASNATVADLVREIPGVELDAAGNLRMRGNTGLLVLINGQRATLKGDALIAFLKQMPASALEKIEVATTPAAQHDADGAGGIVNLKFLESSAERTNSLAGSLSGATARQFMGSLSHNGSARALQWDAMYAVSSLRPHTESTTQRDNFLSPSPLASRQSSHADARHLLHNVFAGGAWQLSPASSINAGFGYSWMRGAYDNATSFSELPATSLTVSTLEHTMPNLDAMLGWSYRKDGPRHFRLDARLRYADASQDFDGWYHANGGLFLRTDMTSRRDEWTGNADAAFDLAAHRVLFGWQSQLRGMTARYLTDRTGMRMVERFARDEDIHAVYGSVSRALGSSFITAGLRVEASSTGISVDEGATKQEDQQLRVFPSLSMHWPHEGNANTEYQLAYARRITRPDATALNPYSMGEDDMNSFIGNPELQPEFVDLLELGIVRHGTAVSVQVTPYLRYFDAPVRAIKAVTASGRATTSLRNLDHARSAGVDLSIKSRLSDAVATSISANVAYTDTRGGVIRADGLHASLRGHLDVQFAPQTSAHLSAYRRSAQTIEQGEMFGAWTSDIALRHRMAPDGRGSVTLRWSDPFDTDRIGFEIGDQTFRQRSERKITSRMLALSFSWAIGGDAADDAPQPVKQKAPQIF